MFFYSNSVCGGNGNNNIGSGLIGMLNPNLDAGYPCLLSIYGMPPAGTRLSPMAMDTTAPPFTTT